MNKRVAVVALRCATAIALAQILPAWTTAVPLTVLAVAAGVAIIRRPEYGAQAIEAIKEILETPMAPDDEK